MKKGINLITLLVVMSSLNAQNFQWAKSFGGTTIEEGTSIHTDMNGSIYTAGGFSGSVDFDPGGGTTILNATSPYSVFVQKMDASGNFLWARSFEGAGISEVLSIVSDASGNIYTTGYFSDTVDFDPGTGTANLTSASLQDIFVHKMDASGNFLWARTFGGLYDDKGKSITVDAVGNVYTIGKYRGTVDFNAGVGVANLSQGGVFILKMNPSGNYLWAKAISGRGAIEGECIKIDTVGNVYNIGSFGNTLDFDPGTAIMNLSSKIGNYDIYVQKLDSMGNFIWAKAFGGNDEDYGRSISLDALGNVYSLGSFEGTADFDPGSGTTNLSSVSGFDIFIQKMDASGNFLWAKKFGGNADNFGSAIITDVSGNVYSTGCFSGLVDFDPGTGTANLLSVGFKDIYVQKLDSSGNFVWATAFGGTSTDLGNSITADALGNIYTTGTFYGVADFDPGAGTVNLTVFGSGDVFVQKMGSGSITAIPEIDRAFGLVSYPNPTKGSIQLKTEEKLKQVEIRLTDAQGREVWHKQLGELSDTQIELNVPAGIYFLHLKSSEGQSVIKLIKE